MLTDAQRRWGIGQWVAWLKDKDIPVLPQSKDYFLGLSQEAADALSPRDLTARVMNDPLFSLRLLRRAARVHSHHLEHETTTPLAAVLQAGFKGLVDTVRESPTADDSITGLMACVRRTTLAASIGHAWASHRADVSPDEVSFAALLAETGTLLFWHFAPDLPLAASEAMRIGRAQRNAEAQRLTAGFAFKAVTMELAIAWELPGLITQLIKGADTPRARIARLATNTARHLLAAEHNAALPSDLAQAMELMPQVPPARLLQALPISDAEKAAILAGLTGDTPEEN